VLCPQFTQRPLSGTIFALSGIAINTVHHRLLIWICAFRPATAFNAFDVLVFSNLHLFITFFAEHNQVLKLDLCVSLARLGNKAPTPDLFVCVNCEDTLLGDCNLLELGKSWEDNSFPGRLILIFLHKSAFIAGICNHVVRDFSILLVSTLQQNSWAFIFTIPLSILLLLIFLNKI
jgi:hypothetical protein